MVTFHVDITSTPVVPAVLAQWRELVSEFMISWDFMEIHWIWWAIKTLENVVYALVNVVPPSEYDLQNLHVCYFKSSVWYLEIRCPQIKRRKNASGLVNVPIKHQPTKWGHLPTPWFFPLKLPFVRSILHSWTNLSTFRDFGANLWTCPKMGGIPDINDSIKKENADRLSNLAGI
jgi:hypothetical protein